MRPNRTHLSILAAALLTPCFSMVAQTAGGPPSPLRSYTSTLAAPANLRSKSTGILPLGISWTVNDVTGGNSALGKISPAGVYTAPSTIPKPREVHIHATVSKPRKFHVWATVIVGPGDAPTYRLVSHWGERGSGPGKFTDPHSLCFDRDHNLIITDALAGHVYRYTREGKLLGNRLGTGQ